MAAGGGIESTLAREYDFIVVGGGSGGCVVARRLAERSDARVLLIEAGPPMSALRPSTTPALWTSLLRGAYDWGYDYAPTPLCQWPRDRDSARPGARRSSSINAMIWNRGHPSDYDAWDAAGATGWDFAAVLPYFKRAEDWEGGADTWRGAGGPLRIERPRDPHPIALAMLEAAPAAWHSGASTT